MVGVSGRGYQKVEHDPKNSGNEFHSRIPEFFLLMRVRLFFSSSIIFTFLPSLPSSIFTPPPNCCRSGVTRTCQSCCQDLDCTEKIVGFHLAGEFEASLCIDSECQTYLSGELSPQIPSDSIYLVWVVSKTKNNPNTYHRLNVPSTVYDDGPLMEQVWCIDFSEQDASFARDKAVVYTHLLRFAATSPGICC